MVTTHAVKKEVRDFIRSHEQRRKQFPRALLVGLIAGVIGTLFRISLIAAESLRTSMVLSLHRIGNWTIVIPMAVGGLGAGLAVYLVKQVAPEASGSGIPNLKAVLLHLRGMRWRRILPVKFIGGLAAIGGGLALGREGPTIQMGGAVGQMVGEWLGVTGRERQTLIAAGAGAGLSAAFNAPLSGMVFVLEEVQRDFTPIVFAASLIASVTADVITRLLTGQEPVFHMSNFPMPPISALGAYILVGVLAGVLGVGYNRGLLYSLNFFQKIHRWPSGVTGALVGVFAGAVAWFLPDAAGGGYPLLANVFSGTIAFGSLIFLFSIRFLLTMLSYGCGAPGGIFAPLLVLGAIMGVLVGQLAHLVFPGMAYYPAAFAVVGMGAYFSAIVRAPLTGIVLMLEMTGKNQQMLPLLVACLVAYGVAEWLGDRPVYEALLERDLLRGQHVPELQETLLLDLTIQPDAPFENKVVRELGLPPGVILVSLHRGMTDIVPMADTILSAGDRISVVVAPQAAEAVSLLREGFGSL
ncbi:MAG: H(+)/Cl(-) exchange transporter ClcA [Armatimonadota bacterium]|nr:H(+)/Cl(-) exchange transporter ClcA [Armatimonadota bacterium]